MGFTICPKLIKLLQYKPKFTLADSILIIPISEANTHKITRYGYSVQEEKSLIWFD